MMRAIGARIASARMRSLPGSAGGGNRRDGQVPIRAPLED